MHSRGNSLFFKNHFDKADGNGEKSPKKAFLKASRRSRRRPEFRFAKFPRWAGGKFPPLIKLNRGQTEFDFERDVNLAEERSTATAEISLRLLEQEKSVKLFFPH